MKLATNELVAARLERDSMPVPECGCQIWLGAISSNGYGALKVNDRQHGVHRLAWMTAKGKIPAGMSVLHKCDVRCCINPDHLFVGTQKDNITDMIWKGRKASSRGELSGHARLTAKDVIAIRADTRLLRIIADDYGIDLSHVGKIKSRRAWAHLP